MITQVGDNYFGKRFMCGTLIFGSQIRGIAKILIIRENSQIYVHAKDLCVYWNMLKSFEVLIFGFVNNNSYKNNFVLLLNL